MMVQAEKSAGMSLISMREGIFMSTFDLKCVALYLMVLDHVGMYFESFLPYGVYLFLRILGRSSYPLFLFCMAQGYRHTRNRKKYLLRLYLGSLFMTGFILFVDTAFPTDGLRFGYHNIFLSLFLVGILISTIEAFLKDRKKGLILAGGIFILQLSFSMAPRLLPVLRNFSGDTITGILPNLALNEYGLPFIILGICMYFLWDKKEMLAIVYLLFCIAQYSDEALHGEYPGFPIQWFMVLALPFILRYNGERGRSFKYFFYIFYPAHTFVLFYLGNFMWG